MSPIAGSPPTRALPEACVVYGAGSFGRSLVSGLREAGVDVVAIFDAFVEDPDGDPPVFDPAKGSRLRHLPVVVGVCNPETDPRSISSLLRSAGHEEIWSPVDAFFALGVAGRPLEHYWLTSDPGLYERESVQIAHARTQLADGRSTEVFSALLEYRTAGVIETLPDVDPRRSRYLPDDLAFIDGPVALIDGGAYDGDTIRAYVDAGIAIEAVLAFEPDPNNFRLLTSELNRHSGLTGVAMPLALGRKTESLRFSANGTTGAAIAPTGEVVVQDVVRARRRTTRVGTNTCQAGHRRRRIRRARRHAEAAGDRPAAPRGLRIPSCQPSLGGSAAASGLGPGYTFYLRCYGAQCFDTVLYAIPES